jgi:hypothetical protein
MSRYLERSNDKKEKEKVWVPSTHYQIAAEIIGLNYGMEPPVTRVQGSSKLSIKYSEFIWY